MKLLHIDLRLAWLLLVVISSLAGCSDPQRSQIVGTWQLEKPDQISERITNPANDTADNNSDSVDQNRMEIVFRRGGGLVTKTKMGSIDREKSGTWELIQVNESERTATVSCTIQSQTTEHEIELLEQGRLKMVPPNMAGTETRLIFRRAD